MTHQTKPQKRKYNTEKKKKRLPSRRIVVPMSYEEYTGEMSTSEKARACLGEQMSRHPELFPKGMKEGGYKFHGWTAVSKKMPEKSFRRIRLTRADEEGRYVAYTIVSCDVLPYLSGLVSEVEKALFLKQFNVPDWALTHVFGRNDSYWYRQTEAFGRYNIAGTTVKEAEKMPTDLLADEKHAKAHGEKWYIATTVGNDCVLGASVSTSADTAGLVEAYGTFKAEVQEAIPGYEPQTVNTDGWAATAKAWQTLFPSVVTILCFLHAFLKIRTCCKRLGEQYQQLKQLVWTIYHAEGQAAFNAEIERLKQWVFDHRDHLTTSALEAIEKLIQRAEQFSLAFDHPTAYRTSNMLDRHMEPMARWLRNGRYFHGHLYAAELRIRSWALFHNFWPYCPRAKVSDSFHSPAHKLNGFIYRENWLENLLVSSSCQGFLVRHKKR